MDTLPNSQTFLVQLLLILTTVTPAISTSSFTILKTNATAKEVQPLAKLKASVRDSGVRGKEASALLAWKSNLDPRSREFISSWKRSNHCEWFGISCNKAGRIARINLQSAAIRGTLDELNFSRLVHLEELSLYNNSLFGNMPFALGTLSKLANLDLGVNNFQGSIPASIGNLSSLITLYLDHNTLSGSIPTSIGNLTKLERLYLNSNQLSGSIPIEIGKLISINYIYMFRNNITGPIPASIGNLSNLVEITLYENKLSGHIPYQFSMLHSLTGLDLSVNNLSGQFPPSIGNLTKLKFLGLFMNQLSGPIPPELGRLKFLWSLKLFTNKLSGSIPTELNNITHLIELSLSENNLTGELPRDICLGGVLKYLTVEKNNFIGNIPKSLKICQSLYRVRLEWNQFTGNISEDLGIYPNLDYIDLSNNMFYGELSANWGFCHNLTSLKISNNRLSGKIPQEVGQAARLVNLDLSSNQLNGTIPKTLANLSSMLYLDLSSNELSGYIPSEIFKLPEVLRLNLALNNLSGQIPAIGDCKQLQKLNLSKNMLTGSIPPNIGAMHHLENLDLSQNMLTGEIPWELGTLQSFDQMNLSHNEISGSIPSSFSQCLSLTSVDISYNQLEGPLPNTTAFQKAILNNNRGLCGNAISGNKSKRFPYKVILLVSGSLIAIIIIFNIFFLSRNRRFNAIPRQRRRTKKRLFAMQSFDGKMAYEDIIEATENFNPRYCIGSGRCGSVFRAKLSSGENVAVKKLQPSDDDSMQNLESFRTEISALSRVKHRNIVKLHGFCLHARQSFLVYELLEGGSLLDVLKNEEKAQNFDWMKRVNVVKGMANALSYLHNDCSPPIIHRDISSKNVLLDSEFNARISDFGCAILSGPESSTPTSFSGTYGYAAPELALSIAIDEKADVYSFGVVALEAIMGKHPEILITFMLSASSNDIAMEALIDKRLPPPSKQTMEEIVLVMKMSLSCLNPNPTFRPTMKQVSGHLSKRNQVPNSQDWSSVTIRELLDLKCLNS